MNLSRAQIEALEVLDVEDGHEVSLRPYAESIWLGVGYAVVKGWATYRGDDHYAITAKGKKHLAALQAETNT